MYRQLAALGDDLLDLHDDHDLMVLQFRGLCKNVFILLHRDGWNSGLSNPSLEEFGAVMAVPPARGRVIAWGGGVPQLQYLLDL